MAFIAALAFCLGSWVWLRWARLAGLFFSPRSDPSEERRSASAAPPAPLRHEERAPLRHVKTACVRCGRQTGMVSGWCRMTVSGCQATPQPKLQVHRASR